VNADIRVLDDPAREAADLLVAAGGHVVLTGGSTPRAAYERAAAAREDWSGVDFWFTDERCVPPDHEHSNFGMADRALLSRIEGATVHRMRGELGPEDGAAAYENELGEFGPDALDLILLGVGPDYARQQKLTIFTAETHICYVQELHLAHSVTVTRGSSRRSAALLVLSP